MKPQRSFGLAIRGAELSVYNEEKVIMLRYLKVLQPLSLEEMFAVLFSLVGIFAGTTHFHTVALECSIQKSSNPAFYNKIHL